MARKESGVFSKEYTFKGSHAERVKALNAKFGKSNQQLFKRNVDVYMIAPLVGFCYQRRANPDGTPNAETTKIFPKQLIKEQDSLWFAYHVTRQKTRSSLMR